MELISPSLADEAAFLTFYHDFLQNDPENADFYRPAALDFAAYVESLNNEPKGIGLPEGYVPCHHYWLRHDNGDIVGVIRIRHYIDNPFLSLEGGHIGYDVAPAHRRRGYGTTLLALGLQKAKAIGLSQVLVTADEDNPGSRKIIEANGELVQFDWERLTMGCPSIDLAPLINGMGTPALYEQYAGQYLACRRRLTDLPMIDPETLVSHIAMAKAWIVVEVVNILVNSRHRDSAMYLDWYRQQLPPWRDEVACLL